MPNQDTMSAGAAAMDRVVLAHMRGAGDFDEGKVKRDGKGRFSTVSSKKVRALTALGEKHQKMLLDKYGQALFDSTSMEDYLSSLPEGQDPEAVRLELETDMRTMEAEYVATESNVGADYIGPEYDPKKRYKAKSTTDFGHSLPLDNFIAARQQVEEEDALQFGVKGMKWGVRSAPDADSAKAMVVRGVAAGGYAVKAGYTSATVRSAVSSGDLKKLNNSSQFKGKDIRANKALQKQYRKAVENVLRSHERRRDRAWRYFDQTTDVLFFASVATRAIHAEGDPDDVEIVGFQLDENGFATGLAKGAPMPEEFIQHFSMDDFIVGIQEAQDGDAFHFGVKGMRWGVRRSKAELAKVSADADPDAIQAVQTQAKINAAGTLNVVSSKDLQQLVDRMKLEDKYIKATLETSATTKKGNSMLSKVVGLVGRELTMKASGKDGPLLQGYKFLKGRREERAKALRDAAAAAAARRKEQSDLAKTQKKREEDAAYNSPSNKRRHPGPYTTAQATTNGPGPAQRRTNYADRVYNVTTLNALGPGGNPLALPPRRKP